MIMLTLPVSQNDVCSYRKDLEDGGQNSIILVLKRAGLTDQEAMDRVGDMVEDCYQRWHEALDDLPPCDDEKMRKDVMRYVDGCRNIALGNLHWRYVSVQAAEAEAVVNARKLMGIILVSIRHVI